MEFGPIVRAMTRNKVRVLLIVLQIAITLAVITNAINMIAAERVKMQRKSGFDDDNLLWVRSRPFAEAYNERSFRITTTQSDLRSLAAIPGIRGVANTNFLPWQGGGSSGELKAAGGDGTLYRTQMYTTSPGITDTLGVRIVSGRNLRESDVNLDPNNTTGTIIISRELEKLLFKGESAVGRQLIERDDSVDNVVGVFDPFYTPYGWPIHEYTYFNAGVVARGGANYLLRATTPALK